MRKFYNLNFFPGIKNIKQVFVICLYFCCHSFSASAQCPLNIDFELGTFGGWQCYTGDFLNGNLVLNPTPPSANQHIMLTSFPGNGIDTYGKFPRNCPNGSGHSIQLGNSSVNHGAESISYTFGIPATANTYNLIYNYAVVLNDGGHPANLQPRLAITVFNVTDGVFLPCPIDPFVVSGSLPGFFTSTVPGPAGSPVRCKDWSAASVKLDGYAGKTIRISFTTTDCGQTAHFGYAYVDINSECSSSFIGAVFCPDDAFINVTAPFGYEFYKWWNANDPSTILANTQTINFTPPPPPGTVLKVRVTPFSGYGCEDTLTAVLLDTLTIQSQAGPDRSSCNNTAVQLGVLPKAGYVYSWNPAAGLSNPNISNPIATPAVTTQYVLTTSHEGGGCVSTDTVIVTAGFIDNTLTVIGPTSLCPNSSQAVILQVLPTDSIQWYQNGIAIPGANQTQYNVLQSGTYHATLFTNSGCILSTVTKVITIYPEPVAGFTVNALNQCFRDHQYVFTNNSTVSSGTLQYEWDLGDATTVTTRDVTHSYAQPGTYTVQLIVTTDNGCKDTSSFIVHVYPMPVAGFTTNQPNQCIKDHLFNFTNTSSISSGALQYSWDLGDGTKLTSTDVSHNYSQTGTYIVKLLVTSDNGCKDSSSFTVEVYASPLAAFTVNKPEECFKDNQFVFTNGSSVSSGTLQYNWDLGNGFLPTIKDVTYSYPVPGNYTVKLLITTDKACKDSSSFNITVYSSPVAGLTINNAHQCYNDNQFIYTNTTTLYSGTLQYYWDLGDGTTDITKDITHHYAQPGVYKVSMLASAAGGCADSSSFTIDVYPYPVSDFYVAPATCVNTDLLLINKTINNTTAVLDYLWEFGNGQTSTLRHPFYSYPAAGNYKIKLTVDIAQCPQVKSIRELDIFVEAHIPGIRYPEKNAIFNYAEPLHARILGTSNTVLWSPATSLDNRFIYSPTFKGINPQLYTIQLKTPNGCITVDTQMVKTIRKIEIYVPTAFTPGDNGMNDYLRPVLMGFVKVNYFRIYNRWGKLLYQMQSDKPGWDGKIDGKLQELQTLVWMIEAVDVDGVVHRRQGTTVLLH